MMAALVVVTYVPALTVVPEAERTGRVMDLAQTVHEAVEETRAGKDVALVMFDGTPLKDASGAPVMKHRADCEKLGADAKEKCVLPFFYKDECKADPAPDACTSKKIAKWVTNNQDTGKEILVLTDVPLVDDDNKPVNDKAGAQIVKHLADCAKAEDQDSCRGLFVDVSNCKISPPDAKADAGPEAPAPAARADRCVRDVVSKWVSDEREMD